MISNIYDKKKRTKATVSNNYDVNEKISLCYFEKHSSTTDLKKKDLTDRSKS